jgi:hypothetical protein
MNKVQDFRPPMAARRKSLIDHIRLLERRYSEPARREAVALLKDRLARISETRGD